MNDNLKELMKRLAEDETLQAKIKAAPGPDEAYSLACSIQDGYTKEEFLDLMKELSDTARQGELDDEDLMAVSGGDATDVVTSISISGAFAAAFL